MVLSIRFFAGTWQDFLLSTHWRSRRRTAWSRRLSRRVNRAKFLPEGDSAAGVPPGDGGFRDLAEGQAGLCGHCPDRFELGMGPLGTVGKGRHLDLDLPPAGAH